MAVQTLYTQEETQVFLGYDWQTSEVKQKLALPQKCTEQVEIHYEIQILKVVSLMHLS